MCSLSVVKLRDETVLLGRVISIKLVIGMYLIFLSVVLMIMM